MNINPVRKEKRTTTEMKQRHFELGQFWPRNTWTTSAHPDRLDEDSICDCCDERATRTAVTNIWGQVYEVYVCDKHYEINNTWRDTIPNEKKDQKTA